MKKKINMNNHVFKGHKTLLGTKYVTYAEVELKNRYNIFPQSKTFDWGYHGSAPLQLAFAILYQVSDEKFAKDYALQFSTEVIKNLKSRDWIIEVSDVQKWVQKYQITNVTKVQTNTIKSVNTTKKPILKKERTARKNNVVRDICKKLNITQKELAKILEIPEGTVSSWAVKNEIPRLGKKAIEFYMESVKHQKVIESFKEFTNLVQKAS